MKKYLVLSALLAFIVASCLEKIHDEVYSQEDLNGKWETNERNSMDCVQQLEISDTTLSEIKICNGIKLEFKARDYSFNGQIVKYTLYGIDMEFQVFELTDQKLILGDLEFRRIED